MLQTDASNTIFQLAADFVNNTSRHIFLTGKAGTGKTTFLKYIKENTRKRAVVVAPTGVAAINAGGVTMHSFFQLPFGPFIPGTSRGFTDNDAVADKHSLFKNIRFNADKRELLQELELLIIDEVSMVRADMLDAMDNILRHFRRKMHLPFGGVQVLYIGDMYQLPPVVPGNEWDILQPYYESPFFFSAYAIAEAPPLYIELKKIYRQSEQLFIDVLNRVRNNQVTEEDFTLLHKRYLPDFAPAKEEKYITLCTHNKKTDAINTAELEKLPGKMIVFNGAVTGDFSDKALPTEMNLQLKVGAQVMFIKNDSGGDRKFFNGKLATIQKINKEEITVVANNNNEEIKIEKETWRNIRYNYHKETDSIKEEELGSFTQYPLRLAWAITIHKSQGLTFDKAIIDAGSSFAAGQVYVALSRCTSLQGLVLHSKLYPSAIATDKRVVAFAQKEAVAEELQQILQHEQRQYWASTLIECFDYRKIIAALEQFRDLVPGKKLPDPAFALALSHTLLNKAQEQAPVAEKFQLQLQQLLQQVHEKNDTTLLEERVNKGIGWFVKIAGEELVAPLQQHIASLKYTAKVKKYIAEAAGIEGLLIQQLHKMVNVSYGDLALCKNPDSYKQYTIERDPHVSAERKAHKNTAVKGSSQVDSLALFKQGNSITAIAGIRQLTEGTIGAHLAMFILTGEVRILELITEERLNIILPIVREIGGHTVTPVKEIVGDDFTYAEIRIVLNYWQRLEQEKLNA
ncbi:MAG: helix-turn-helix domain-containing protein [Chitinophagaceae bacterium]